MLTIHKIDTQYKIDVNQFVDLPYRLYAGHQPWVPPPKVDARMFLNWKKHPFYEHSTAGATIFSLPVEKFEEF